ncbi:MAG: hypothetical protein JO359_04865, partial [Candidatus Eremiobacteraeota bacterium]|nr:hypothetical protein [Candidatus Eremiobacteraeota bacterium]
MTRSLAAVFVVAILVAFVIGIHSRLENAFFAWLVQSKTGADAVADGVTFGGDGFVATNLRVTNPEKTVTLEAPSALVRLDWSTNVRAIRLTEPHVVLQRDHARDDLSAIAGSIVRLTKEGELSFLVHDGSLEIARSHGSPPTLVVKGIEADLHRSEAEFSYEARALVMSDGAPYPISASGTQEGTHTEVTWQAEALPLAPLLDLANVPGLVPRGGILRQFSASSAGGRAIIEDGRFALGEPAHEISSLRGNVAFSDGGIASPKLAGKLDGAPLEMLGRLEGKDVAAFARLLLGVAAEPNLQEARLEATAPGVAFAKYRLQSPTVGKLAIHVACVNPDDPTISLNTVLAGDHVTSGGERTSTMGQRTGAVLGLDGDY